MLRTASLGILWLGAADGYHVGGAEFRASKPGVQERSASPSMMPSPFRVRERLQNVWSNAAGKVVPTADIDEDPASDPTSDDVPAVLSDEICLTPGRPVVRVEVAPGNARRIFTGIDIVAECNVLEAVWRTLTDYENLADAVPNLISNEVVSLDERGGARLKQVGAAKLAPVIVFRAQTTLDVREYPEGIPAQMEADHLLGAPDDATAASGSSQSTDSAAVRAFDSALPLVLDVFPRPYCISSLPHRDVTMQGVEGKGDFRHYQGVWRLQPLPGCAPPGSNAMRLTYSVELSPRAWVPVGLLEGRIAEALGENLEAIRDYVHAAAADERKQSGRAEAPSAR
jgi:hypothetical protein